jgi:hypothetical protein
MDEEEDREKKTNPKNHQNNRGTEKRNATELRKI